MEIVEVNSTEYDNELKYPYLGFNSGIFNNLNKKKADEIFYLLFKDNKYRLGIVGGIKDNQFVSPFSAPFGGFSFFSKEIRLQYIEEAIILLKEWASKKKYDSIALTLPPQIYDSSFISKQINCLWRQRFTISRIDLNYAFDLDSLNSEYFQNIWYSARKNLQISLKSGLTFKICSNPEEKRQVYEIILKNRDNHGYPLRMSWEQVRDTIQIIPADFFLVNGQNKSSIASAIVFHVSRSIVQVIYWGDIEGYSDKKPMNFISYKVFEYYKTQGKKMVDIGPSSENSIPNFGLCEFKESIGCSITPKYSFKFSFQ